jgi:hypothetical protein
VNDVEAPSTLPEPKRPSAVEAALRLLFRLVGLSVLAVATLPFWPLYWLGILIWYIPPNVPRLAQAARYLRLAWTVRPPAPGLSFVARCWLTATIAQKVLLAPVKGLAWLLDELLYGRALDTTPVEEPVFVVSAARSGSTQIALYLEQDPDLVAPNLLQSMFPYLWLWRLAPRTIGRLISADQVREKTRSMMPPELLERHEGDPFRLDTFDGAFYSFHLNHLSPSLGPQTMVEEFHFGVFAPHNRRLWEEDFVELVDRIGRKTLLHAGPGAVGSPRRLLLKGHFLCGASALERRYPNACFLTVIREPAPRLRSGINYLRVNPADPVLGPIPWVWLATALERTESEYCEVEHAWFTGAGSARRCVVRFSEFVHDLETAMSNVYRCCCDVKELPSHVPTSHAPRERANYSVNRSLADLGIDERALSARLASYVEWCRGDDDVEPLR